MKELKTALLDYVGALHEYDYIALSAILALFILLLVLSLLLRKRLIFSLFLILFAFFSILFGPPITHSFIRANLYKTDIELTLIKELEFSNALVVKGNLQNRGKTTFTKCTIIADIVKVEGNFFTNFVASLDPIRSAKIKKDVNISIGDSIPFKILVEPFTYKDDYNITVASECL